MSGPGVTITLTRKGYPPHVQCEYDYELEIEGDCPEMVKSCKRDVDAELEGPKMAVG